MRLDGNSYGNLATLKTMMDISVLAMILNCYNHLKWHQEA